MDDPDFAVRLAAFTHLDRLRARHGWTLPWEAIDGGFHYQGKQLYLANKPRGIFRPKEMRAGALSIKRTVPRRTRSARYLDAEVGDDSGTFRYDLQGHDVDSFDNALLHQAHALRAPLIYFYGIEPCVYLPPYPVYVVDFDRLEHRCTIVVDSPSVHLVPEPVEQKAIVLEARREYVTRECKVRVHQAAFRELVLDAYERRCAVCRLPRVEILEAAHILPDRDERGRPEVPNGLALCRLHHGAFDTAMLGIDPDGVIRISRDVLADRDGDVLELGIKAFHGRTISAPSRIDQRPRREYLEERYVDFLYRERAA